jgi:2-dehydropantoate 2-reductase
MKTQASSVLIVGTGAMASFFAARLAASGIQVNMLGTWIESIHALNESGVCLMDRDGFEKVYPVKATQDPHDCIGSRFALILVKSFQTRRVAEQLKICLAKDGIALTLQNGLENDTTLAAMLGEDRVAIGVTTIGATLLEPGRVRYGGDGKISLAEHARISPFSDILSQAGFFVETVEDTESLVWGKLVVNAAINPLTALLRVPNGELLARRSAHKLMNLVTQETVNVAEAIGVRLPYSDPISVVELVAERTASNKSSMLKDVLRGSQTEINAINGAIVAIGEREIVPVHLNRALWLIINAIERAPRSQELELHEEQADIFPVLASTGKYLA